MKIFFRSEQIIPELKSTTGHETIREMVDHVACIGRISREAKESISFAVRHRENSMSTGIGFGIAIPHASTPFIDKITVAFGRSVKGIDFKSLDAQPVRLVVLMIIPEGEKQKYLPLLSHISRLLQDQEVRLTLENARDADAIGEILNGNPSVSI